MFKTVKGEVEAEISEKKSKFICHIYHVETVEEANDILRKLRRKYHDARHNCYAYKIHNENVSRASDDGEPSGTAGTPILNILNGKNLSNILVVVTRYFGGILLGTGGLVRAYSLATTTALEKTEICEQELGLEVSFCIEYKDLEELKYFLKKKNVNLVSLEYDEKIKVIVDGEKENIRKIFDNEIYERIQISDVVMVGEKYICVDKKIKS